MTWFIIAGSFITGGLLLAAIIARAGRAAWRAYEHEYPWPETDGIPEWVNHGTPLTIIPMSQLIEELNIALWEIEMEDAE